MKKLELGLAIVLAAIMILSAINKLASSEFRGDLVDQLNVPGWFLVLVSLLELGLAVDLLWPRFRILGGVGVFVTMIGAALFNAFGDTVDGTNPRAVIPVNLVLAIVGLAVAWLAAGQPKAIGSLFSTAKAQALGQADMVGDAATDAVT